MKWYGLVFFLTLTFQYHSLGISETSIYCSKWHVNSMRMACYLLFSLPPLLALVSQAACCAHRETGNDLQYDYSMMPEREEYDNNMTIV